MSTQIAKQLTPRHTHQTVPLHNRSAGVVHSTETIEATAEPLDRALAELTAGSQRFATTTIEERIALAEGCIDGIVQTARDWVSAACHAKGIAAGSPLTTEEIAGGPLVTLRYLRLLIHTLRDIQERGVPRLAGKVREDADGRLLIPVIPIHKLFDTVAFFGFKAHVRMRDGVTRDNLHQQFAPHYCGDAGNGKDVASSANVALVLGAGNVSSIPATDTFEKIFAEGKVVLLKMHPVNDYLLPIFQRAFAPLIDSGYLRIVGGGADVGAAAINHQQVDEVHITGGIDTHDAIVWGGDLDEQARRKQENDPVLTKPISSELGNVSPWIVMPGPYSQRQLKFQAENVAASAMNNAAFNCLATRVLITWKGWDQRDQFLDELQSHFDNIPHRKAYYPGAHERYRRFTGEGPEPHETETLPWTLLRDIDHDESPHFLEEESFVCVLAEVALDADTEDEFLQKAVEFVNEKLWGTLCAAVTVHPRSRRGAAAETRFQSHISRLKYGAVGINQWPGLIYGLASIPWGGFPGNSIADTQSGVGWVHNTFLLENVQQSILDGPLTVWPKPIWFPSHTLSEPVAWKLLDLYHQPSLWKVCQLAFRSVKGSFLSG